MMMWKRATYFTDSEMIKYYQKTCGWNSKCTKTRKHITNNTRYTTLKINFYGFNWDVWLLQEYQRNTDLQLAH